MFGPGGGGAGPGVNEGLLIAILGGVCAFAVVMLAVSILFLLNIMRTLQLVRPRNRAMEPGMVWLNFVPCLNIVWQFLTVIWVAKSLDAEFHDRGIHQTGEDYGKKVGLAGLITNVAAGIVGQVFQSMGEATNNLTLVMVGTGIALVGALISLVAYVLYWLKISGYRKELQESRGRDGDEYEDDRDAPYRRRDDRDDEDDNRDRDDGDRRR